jgi:transposase
MRRPSPLREITGPGGTLVLRPDDEVVLDLVMLVEGETSGRDLDEILGHYGRSRSTYYEKLRRFREEGLEGLRPRPPGPRNAWRRPLEVVRFIVTARLKDQTRSAADIAADLARQGRVVSVRSIERTLSQFGLTRPTRAAPARAAAEQPTAELPTAPPPSQGTPPTPEPTE